MTSLYTTGRQFVARLLPVWRRLRIPVLWTLGIAYFGFAAILLTLRYSILPNIADYRDDLEQVISSSLDLPVSIAEVRADWRGLRPQLTLVGLRISDKQQRPALAFDTVDAVIGSYTNNSLTRSARHTYGLTQANVSGGPRSIVTCWYFATFQYEFNPVLPKNNTKTMTLDFSITWARRP